MQSHIFFKTQLEEKREDPNYKYTPGASVPSKVTWHFPLRGRIKSKRRLIVSPGNSRGKEKVFSKPQRCTNSRMVPWPFQLRGPTCSSAVATCKELLTIRKESWWLLLKEQEKTLKKEKEHKVSPFCSSSCC